MTTSTLIEKANAIQVSLTDYAASEAAKSETAEQQFLQSNDADYKRAMQKAATKDNYITDFLASISESALKSCAKTFSLDAVIDVCNDSYAMKKLRALCEAIAANDISKLSADNQIETFCAVFALASDDTHINTYRAECKSARQLQMCFKLFERLDILKREKRDSSAFDHVVKNDSKARKAIDKLYA